MPSLKSLKSTVTRSDTDCDNIRQSAGEWHLFSLAVKHCAIDTQGSNAVRRDVWYHARCRLVLEHAVFCGVSCWILGAKARAHHLGSLLRWKRLECNL